MERQNKIQQILIADDHLLFGRGLRTVISAESDLAVLAEVSTVAEAIAKASEAAPDLIVIDVGLFHRASEGDRTAFRELQPNTAILYLAEADQQRHLEVAIETGGHAYLLKSSSPSQLVKGMRRACRGEKQDGQTQSESSADLRALADLNARYLPGAVLTSRELEILKLLAEGHTVRESADELSLSIKTIEAHKLNLMRKLDIHNRANLIQYAIANGIIVSAAA